MGILDDKDRLALVGFSDKAEVAMELVAMDLDGKQKAGKKCEALYPHGMTNLWDGLLAALEILKKSS